MSDLVGNPEDRFSRVEAHVISYLLTLSFVSEIPTHAKVLLFTKKQFLSFNLLSNRLIVTTPMEELFYPNYFEHLLHANCFQVHHVKSFKIQTTV